MRLICLMYTTFLALGTAAYRLAGMNVFDSLIHAMCALSTGGFSTRAQSIGYYQSPLIEFITVVLMLIGTTNFAALLLLMRGQVRKFLAVSEIRFLGLILAAAIPLTALVLLCAAYTGLPGSFRIAFFEVISALSTSGFSTVGYADWPQAAVFLLDFDDVDRRRYRLDGGRVKADAGVSDAAGTERSSTPPKGSAANRFPVRSIPGRRGKRSSIRSCWKEPRVLSFVTS